MDDQPQSPASESTPDQEASGVQRESLEQLQGLAELLQPADPVRAVIPLTGGGLPFPAVALGLSTRLGTPVINALLGLCVLMFVLTEWLGSSTDSMTLFVMGVNLRDAVLEGQTFRLLSAVFLHIGAAHLFSNLMGLFALGQTVERIYGHSRTLLVFLACGIGGCLVSLMLHEGQAAGASGALFGFMGLMAVFPLSAGRSLPKPVLSRIAWSIVPWLAFNLMITFTSSHIDVGGHLGGLACGAVLGLTLRAPTLNPWARSSVLYYLFAAGVFLLTGLLLVQYAGWWLELRAEWASVGPMLPG